MASGAQIRANRVLLGWTPRDLAHMALTRMAKLQDRIIEAQGPVQLTLVQYARFQPSP